MATAAEGLPAEVRGRRIHRLLKDPRRVVRIEAARALADVSSAELPEGSRRAHESALAEYRAAQRLNSDEPASHVNLGLLAQRTGKFREAERNYRVALDLGDYFVPAHVNLADLYRASGRDTEAEEVLARAVEAVPDSAEIRHALGLTYVRLRRRDEALAELARASELAPGTPRFTYVYGVALHSYGRPDEAVAHLEKAHRRHPTDTTILRTLVEFLAGAGRNEASQAYARKLEGLMSTYR